MAGEGGMQVKGAGAQVEDARGVGMSSWWAEAWGKFEGINADLGWRGEEGGIRCVGEMD